MSAKLALYRTMYLMRRFEQAAGEALRHGDIHGSLRNGKGQEGITAGVCSVLQDGDVVYPGLRGFGEFLARGTEPRLLAAELFGRAAGLNGGRAGSLHLSDVSHGVMAVSGVLGANLPLAGGQALAQKLNRTGAVTTCFVGDRATNEGIFHETLNLAALWGLPVLYVGVNNAPAEAMLALPEHTAAGSMVALARVHGIHSESVDGTDALEVQRVATELVSQLRTGTGPRFMECTCYPLDEPSREQIEALLTHMRQTRQYTGMLQLKLSMVGQFDAAAPAAWLAGDPLAKLDGNIDDLEATAAIREEVEGVVRDAMEFAASAAVPVSGSGVTRVFAS